MNVCRAHSSELAQYCLFGASSKRDWMCSGFQKSATTKGSKCTYGGSWVLAQRRPNECSYGGGLSPWHVSRLRDPGVWSMRNELNECLVLLSRWKTCFLIFYKYS